MATYNKFHCFGKDLHEGAHNLSSNPLKIALTNTAPLASNQTLANISEITPSGGYSAGGISLPVASSNQVAGVYKLIVQDVTFTCTNNVGPFRYAAVYNSANNKLIGWYDYGRSITLAPGESFFFDFSDDLGIFSHS